MSEGKITKAEYLARKERPYPEGYLPYTARDAEFMRELSRKHRAEHCSGIEVSGEAGLHLPDFKVYVDRNIAFSASYDGEPSDSHDVRTRVVPGTHTVIVRDREVQKPGRRESNLVQVEIPARQRAVLRATLVGDALRLEFVEMRTVPREMEA